MSDDSYIADQDDSGDERHLPVHVPDAGVRPAERVPAGLTSPLAAATGGLLAGMATMVLVRLLRSGGRRRGVLGSRRRGARAAEVAATRSFLVDVHFLKR